MASFLRLTNQMLQLWIVAIIITTTGWPWTAYLHLGFFHLWHINKEEEVGRQPSLSPYSGSSGRQVVIATQGFSRTNSYAVNTGGRWQEGAAGYLSLTASAAAAIFVSCCPHGTLPARAEAGSTWVPLVSLTEELCPFPTPLPLNEGVKSN